MAILSFPNSTSIHRARWLLRGATIQHISPLTRRSQTLEIMGARWLASFELVPMRRADAEAWMVFLTRLNGRAGRFYAGDPSATTPRGTLSVNDSSMLRVYGANQRGTLLSVDYALHPPGAQGTLCAGDYFSFDTPSGWRELHIVTENITLLHTGVSGIRCSPPIRESPADNATITVYSPTCVMRLATDTEAKWHIDESSLYQISFSAEEAFSADLG